MNVRRLLDDIEETIYRDTRWAVFEPNHAQTWDRLRRQVEELLEKLWRRGALAGTTREEAFRVQCGGDTMSQHDIDEGRLIMVIGLAPERPAEFVYFRIEQKCGP